MKRFRLGCGEENVDNVNMAGVLMLLSRSGNDEEIATRNSSTTMTAKVFECKTCSRQFPSFQALGGHRASHKKPRPHVAEGSGGEQQAWRHEKPRVHECSICGLEFSIGQALGGHMRRHRAEAAGVLKNIGGGKKRVWLDLNLPPTPMTEDETDCRKMGFGLEIADPIPCLY